MKLSELLENLRGIKVANFHETEISGVKCNSKNVGIKDVFVAISGHTENGEKYIEEALLKGASALVCTNPDIAKKYRRENVIIAENIRKTLAEMCAKMSGNPHTSMKFIGITGTKGKTTTSKFISELLSRCGVRNLFIGTGGGDFSGRKYINTTPDPTKLFPILGDAKKRGIDTVVCEVSSAALKDFRIYGLTFEKAVFTGIGKDHIGKGEHESFDDYLNSKRQLFSDYGVNFAVLNADDKYSDLMRHGDMKSVLVGTSDVSDYKITGFSDSFSGGSFRLGNVPVKISLAGLYNAMNASLALVTASDFLNAPISYLSKKIYDIKIPGRFVYNSVGGVNILIDYAHNFDSFREILTLAKRLTQGSVICVFGSVGGRGYARRRELAEAAEAYSDFSVITADDPNFENEDEICQQIYGNFKNKSKAKILTDRRLAIEYALSIAKGGDTIAILGKGGEERIIKNGICIPYSDEETITALKKLSAP